MVVLKRTRRGWEEPPPPRRCPQGHELRGLQRVLVGTQQCATCADRGLGPHRSYTCRTCWDTVYYPPAGPECTFVAFDSREVPTSSVQTRQPR